MRRISMMTILLGPLGPLGLCADAQDLGGIQISPPIEVQSEEVHQPPPTPSPPVNRPAPGPTPPPATGLTGVSPMDRQPEFLPRPDMIPQRPVVRPSSRDTNGLTVQPPRESTQANEHLSTTRIPETITIAPAIRPEGADSPSRNPSLPSGPDRGGVARSRQEVEGRAARGPAAGQPPRPDQGRPGLLGGMLDRLSGRPAPPAAPVARRSDRPTARPIDPNDPAATEALKRELGQVILQREADRIASVEILVVGPRVHIRAEAARPWQRRALRRSLEELPMPSGFRSTVDIR